MIKSVRVFLSALCVSLCVSAPVLASVRIRIDLSSQRLEATAPNGESVAWKISSGRRGYETPSGQYKVYRMEADHLSDEYDQAPMPYAMFFSPRGLAIHGSYERSLGRPASHGCVRLSVDHARQLYGWVEKHGGATVEIVGAAPAGGRKERLAREREEPVERFADESLDEDRSARPRRHRAGRKSEHGGIYGGGHGPIEVIDPETGALESVYRY